MRLCLSAFVEMVAHVVSKKYLRINRGYPETESEDLTKRFIFMQYMHHELCWLSGHLVLVGDITQVVAGSPIICKY